MGHIVAVGHRGMRHGLYPENTLMAHDAAYELGARGVEFDVRCSASGEFFLFHDASLSLKTNGAGFFASKSSGDIRKLRLKHKNAQTEFTIPTLEQALENVRGRFMVDIDFKDGPDDSGRRIREALENTGFHKEDAPLVTIFCRNNFAFEKIRDLNDLYSVRPLYGGAPFRKYNPFFKKRKHARQMRDFGVNVIGLREYQFEQDRANFLRDLPVQVFANAMKNGKLAAALNEIYDKRDWRRRTKHPPTNEQQRLEIYSEATEMGSLFVQTDHLVELVPFLKQKGLYQDQVLGRDFRSLNLPFV